MSHPVNKNSVSPLALQLLKYVAGIYTLFILILTLMQLMAEYSYEKENLVQELGRLESAFNPPLSVALWDLHVHSVHQTILGMQQLDAVLGVRVDSLTNPQLLGNPENLKVQDIMPELSEKKIAFHYYSGLVQDAGGKTAQFSLGWKGPGKPVRGMFEPLTSVSFPIIHKLNEESFLVGVCHVYTGMKVVIARISFGFFLIILASVAKTILLWALFYFFVKKLVARPLACLTREVARLNPENPLTDSVETENLSPELLGRKDEIGFLASGMKAMGKGLSERSRQIEHYQKNLETMVQSRTQELKRVQNELFRMEKMTGLCYMVTGVAHELNTPAGIILTAASTCASRATETKRLSEQEKLTKKEFFSFIDTVSDHCQVILENIKKASGLINSFKEIAPRKDRESAVEFDISEHMEGLRQSLIRQYAGHKFSLYFRQVSVGRIISFPVTLSQVLSQLVGNAIVHSKHCPHSIRIEVTVKTTEKELSVNVSDNGPGIPPENMDKIFDPFFSTSMGQGGYGLGLTVVHNLVTYVLNGKIICDSLKNPGASFTVTVPLRQTAVA